MSARGSLSGAVSSPVPAVRLRECLQVGRRRHFCDTLDRFDPIRLSVFQLFPRECWEVSKRVPRISALSFFVLFFELSGEKMTFYKETVLLGRAVEEE